MARRLRTVIPGLSHHVYQRGHNACAIFACDEDYRRFLSQARESMTDHGVDAHAFTLMTNHYHFVLTPETKPALSEAMQDLLSEYTKYFNRKYDRSGTLWNSRFCAKPIEDERYWLNCLRYVEANPVEAKIVATPEHYPWSSYRVHATGEPSGWLVLHHVYLSLGKTPLERQLAYRALWDADPVPDWWVD
jgi:REP-associated tyrosine transposase